MKRFISVLPALFAFLLITSSNVSAADNSTMAMVGITRGQIVRISLFHPNDVAGLFVQVVVLALWMSTARFWRHLTW